MMELINFNNRFREVFEPFHPQFVDRMNFLEPYQYVTPRKEHLPLKSAAGEVLSGKFMHPRVDAVNNASLHQGLLIKDVFAQLFSYWASLHSPHLQIIFLIRNSFAVALS